MATAADPVLWLGPPSGRLVVIVPPLFEEANRMRRTLVEAMRALAARGIATALPDLPGQNESLLPTEAATLGGWCEALAALAAAETRPIFAASFRGGALVDHTLGARAYWRCAPVTGASLLRTMRRGQITRFPGGEVLFGNRLSNTLLAELADAVPRPVAPLTPFTGTLTPLWLRAEPDHDPAASTSISGSIESWLPCAG